PDHDRQPVRRTERGVLRGRRRAAGLRPPLDRPADAGAAAARRALDLPALLQPRRPAPAGQCEDPLTVGAGPRPPSCDRPGSGWTGGTRPAGLPGRPRTARTPPGPAARPGTRRR